MKQIHRRGVIDVVVDFRRHDGSHDRSHDRSHDSSDNSSNNAGVSGADDSRPDNQPLADNRGTDITTGSSYLLLIIFFFLAKEREGGGGVPVATIDRGALWNLLAGVGGMWQRRAGRRLPEPGNRLAGVALAFGLSVLTMAYALGPLSGAHFNPAVSVGLWVGGRFLGRDVPAYVAAQVLGALLAGLVLYGIASGAPDFHASSGFASNGYGVHSPGFAPLAIGLALTVVHLVSIPVTNTSVNPARSTGVAFFAGGWALRQLWLFWVAPLVGGALGGLAYRTLSETRSLRVTREKHRTPDGNTFGATATKGMAR